MATSAPTIDVKSPRSCSAVNRLYSVPRSMSHNAALRFRPWVVDRGLRATPRYICPSCQRSTARFSTGARYHDQRPSAFRTRLRAALKDTKVQWKPIPVGLGITFLGALQFYRIREREKRRQQEEDDAVEDAADGSSEPKGRPRRRQRIRPSGPW